MKSEIPRVARALSSLGLIYLLYSASHMASIQINIAYDGEALRDATMDVRDLAPALLAVGELFSQANRVLNGDRAAVAVHVKSDFSTGSFDIYLDVLQHLYPQIKSFLLGDDVKAAKELATLVGLYVGGGALGLFQFIKWLKGRTPESVTTLDAQTIRIQIDQTIHYDITPELLRLYNDLKVREAAEKIVRPLDDPGIDKFQIKDEDGTVRETITKDDVAAFELPDTPERVLVDETSEAVFEVVKPSFDESLKWMFSDGNAKFSADIADDLFLSKVDNREVSFTKGTVLKVRLRKKSVQTPSGLRTEYIVLRVVNVIPPPQQLSLLPSPDILPSA